MHYDAQLVYDYNFPSVEPESKWFQAYQSTHNCIDLEAFAEYYDDTKKMDSGQYVDWYSEKYKTPPQAYNQIPNFIGVNPSVSFYHYKKNLKPKFRKTLFFYPIALYSEAMNSIGDYEHMVFDKITKDVIEEVKTSPHFYLMISYFYEGIVYTKEMENIYKWIKKYEIPEDKIYFVYGNHNIDDWWNDISKSDIINKKLNFISYIWPLQYMPDYYRPIIDEYKNITKDLLPHERKIWDNVFETSENNQSINLEYKVEKKKYDFNCLLRQLRPHRILLLCFLRLVNLLDKNLISYDLYSLGFKFEFGWYWLIEGNKTRNYPLVSNEGPFKWVDYLQQYSKLWIEQPKKVVDIENTEEIHGLRMENDIPYKDSMFTIVSETYFFEQSKVHYISEKVLKPMIHNHPFILFAKPGILKFLKEKGFKTFHPYIDEIYDEIDDDIERFACISREIERLCSQTDEEKLEWMKNIKPIVEHNFNHFMLYDSKLEDTKILNGVTKMKKKAI